MIMAIPRSIFWSGNDNQDLVVNALIASGEAIRSGWRESQEEILLNLLKRSVYSENFSQQDLAQSLGLNPSALSKRLKSSSIRVYLRGRAASTSLYSKLRERERTMSGLSSIVTKSILDPLVDLSFVIGLLFQVRDGGS